MAIGDYTDNLGAIDTDAKNQKADLKLSQEVSQAWIKPMTDFHGALKTVRGKTNGLDKVPGDVGGLQSAQDTVKNLARTVTQSGGVRPALDEHMKYQEKLAKLVKDVHDLMIKSG